MIGCVFLGCGSRATSSTEAPTAEVSSAETSTVGFTPAAIALREVADSNLKELVDERLVFVDSAGVEWVAPRGTRTDGASVPRLALPVTDGRFDKAFLKAAVIHDAYCQSDNEAVCPDQYRSRKWRAVHRMFYEASIAGGASEEIALVMFAAVWLGGPRWDDPEHSLDQVPDERLEVELAACSEWIGREKPTVQEVEAWMDRREPALRDPESL
jgi:hypothetical protein